MSLEDALLLEEVRLPELELLLDKLEERGSCETEPAERLLLVLPKLGADVELGREVLGLEGVYPLEPEVLGLELLGLELLGLELLPLDWGLELLGLELLGLELVPLDWDRELLGRALDPRLLVPLLREVPLRWVRWTTGVAAMEATAGVGALTKAAREALTMRWAGAGAARSRRAARGGRTDVYFIGGSGAGGRVSAVTTIVQSACRAPRGPCRLRRACLGG